MQHKLVNSLITSFYLCSSQISLGRLPVELMWQYVETPKGNKVKALNMPKKIRKKMEVNKLLPYKKGCQNKVYSVKFTLNWNDDKQKKKEPSTYNKIN